QMGNPSDAIKSLERAHSISSELLGSEHARSLETQVYLIKSYQLLGEFEKVRILVAEVLPKMNVAFGVNDPRTYRIRAFLTIAEVETGFPERAHERASAMLKNSIELFPDGHWDVTQCKFLLAHSLLALGKPQEVVDLMNPVMKFMESSENVRLIRKYQPRYWLAKSHNELGNHQHSIELLSVVLEELSLNLGSKHPHVLQCQFEYAKALAATGDSDGLDHRIELLKEGFQESFGPEHPYTKRVEAYEFISAVISGPAD
ncbi:MAG: tetratricopeptide repeat protein, partial [Phycisphaerales bacterium]|nr:tetratricopeptide repeat protein [Phycisphaerales bacterium]